MAPAPSSRTPKETGMRQDMKKFLLGLVATTAVAAPLALVSAPAHATDSASPCITRSEYHQVHEQMSLEGVRQIVGGSGMKVASYPANPSADLPGWQRRAFRKCDTRNAATMEFETHNGRWELVFKMWRTGTLDR